MTYDLTETGLSVANITKKLKSTGCKNIVMFIDACRRHGRRTALPRHQTLGATLDWSHALLSETERIVFRRLSLFAGSFSLQGAVAVSAESALPPPQVVDGLSGLVAKSLVAVEAGGLVRRYRLLDTTRGYAFDKLGGSGERKIFARRHAEYYRGFFEQAEAEWKTRPPVEWVAVSLSRTLSVVCEWAT